MAASATQAERGCLNFKCDIVIVSVRHDNCIALVIEYGFRFEFAKTDMMNCSQEWRKNRKWNQNLTLFLALVLFPSSLPLSSRIQIVNFCTGKAPAFPFFLPSKQSNALHVSILFFFF